MQAGIEFIPDGKICLCFTERLVQPDLAFVFLGLHKGFEFRVSRGISSQETRLDQPGIGIDIDAGQFETLVSGLGVDGAEGAAGQGTVLVAGDEHIQSLDLPEHFITLVFPGQFLGGHAGLQVPLEPAVIHTDDIVGLFQPADQLHRLLCGLQGIREAEVLDVLFLFPVGNIVGDHPEQDDLFAGQFLYGIGQAKRLALVDHIVCEQRRVHVVQMPQQHFLAVVEIMVAEVDEVILHGIQNLCHRGDIVLVLVEMIKGNR